jgi:hypothetical protein
MFDGDFIALLNESKIDLSNGQFVEFKQKIGAALAAFQLVEADSLIELCQLIVGKPERATSAKPLATWNWLYKRL